MKTRLTRIGDAVRFALKAIAAVIIGGTSLNGGRGSLDGLILMGVGAFIRQMITGFVIILAVILGAHRARLAERAGA